jgi:hypothetical protein
MIQKKVVITVLVAVSTLLNGMQIVDKKTKKAKQELTASSEENNLSSMRSSSGSCGKKTAVKSLKDIKELKRVQNQFQDQSVASRSESSLDKK